MYVYHHQIAGINFRTEMDTWVPWLDNSYFRFFVHNGATPDVFLRLACIYPDSLIQPPIDPQVIASLFHSIGFNQKNIDSPLLRAEAVRSRLRAVMGHPEQVGLEIKLSSIAIFDFDRRELDIFFACGDYNNYSSSRLGPVLFAPFLVTFNALMVHSAGLMCGDRVAVFMAPDEGGKTTVVNLADTDIRGILSDDQVIISQTDSGLMAHGTPWGLVTDGPKYARLGGLFLLEKAAHFELSPLTAVEALDYLWNEHQGYWAFLPKTLRLKAFDFVNSICHLIPTYRMRFSKDYVDWNAIRLACQQALYKVT